MVQIYALLDPRTKAVRYIGKAVDANKRLKGHLRERRRRSPLYSWLRKLDRAPILQILATVPASDWPRAEKQFIFEARLRGERLLNIADGGDEPACPTATRAANGRKVASAIHTDPLKRRVWEIKRAVGELLRSNISEGVKMRLRIAMRYAATKRPELFGGWNHAAA